MGNVVVALVRSAETDALAKRLRADGHRVTEVHDAAALETQCQRARPDVVLAGDVGAVRVVRGASATRKVPVIVVSEDAAEIDRVVAFEVGADDFVATPYFPRELALRVRAVMRRDTKRPRQTTPRSETCCGLALGASSVTIDGRLVRLPPREHRLLALMLEHCDRVLTRERLLAELWDGPKVTVRAVDSCVKRLRRRLEHYGACIETVRSVGYRMRKPCAD